MCRIEDKFPHLLILTPCLKPIIVVLLYLGFLQIGLLLYNFGNTYTQKRVKININPLQNTFNILIRLFLVFFLYILINIFLYKIMGLM